MKLKIPNILTIGRIILTPIFIGTFYLPGPMGDWIPFFIFLLASFTDFLDGLLARLYKEESKLGELLDPIADKIIVASALILLVMDDTIKDLRNHPTIKFLYSTLHQGYGTPNDVPLSDNFYSFESGVNHDIRGLECIGTDRMVAVRTTLNTCMNLAAHMGAKNIMICGKDEGKIDGRLYVDGYVKSNWTDSENWNGIEHWLYLTSKNTRMIRDRIKNFDKVRGMASSFEEALTLAKKGFD